MTTTEATLLGASLDAYKRGNLPAALGDEARIFVAGLLLSTGQVKHTERLLSEKDLPIQYGKGAHGTHRDREIDGIGEDIEDPTRPGMILRSNSMDLLLFDHVVVR